MSKLRMRKVQEFHQTRPRKTGEECLEKFKFFWKNKDDNLTKNEALNFSYYCYKTIYFSNPEKLGLLTMDAWNEWTRHKIFLFWYGEFERVNSIYLQRYQKPFKNDDSLKLQGLSPSCIYKDFELLCSFGDKKALDMTVKKSMESYFLNLVAYESNLNSENIF